MGAGGHARGGSEAAVGAQHGRRLGLRLRDEAAEVRVATRCLDEERDVRTVEERELGARDVGRLVGSQETHGMGDVRDLGAVERALDETGAEIVIHMAAQALVHSGCTTAIEARLVFLQIVSHDELAARAEAYELAFRMQMSVPGILTIDQEDARQRADQAA